MPFSFECRYISLLWILISNRSKVAVPFPHGDFLVVILSFFVGKGTGPEIAIPDFFAISFIDSQILLRASISMLLSLILTFVIVRHLRFLDNQFPLSVNIK